MTQISVAAMTALVLIALTSAGIAEQTKPQAPKPCPQGQVRNTNGICVAPKGKVDLQDLSITKRQDSSSPR
jgi:hypothetical protein